ncbi:MAG: protein kinase, partial [Myxococcales bacterium]|nr:protein kinase [Myxococcales bacterium]
MGKELSESKFRAEALSLSRLNHPNIVRLLKYGIKSGRPYMVMEYVSGAHSLADEIKLHDLRGETCPLGTARHILTQVLNALSCAHQAEIVHRDIKPDNIMLQPVAGDEHFVRVLDFGLAKFLKEGSDTSLVLGTPMYMAPEQLARRNLGPWTDLYALAVITFELLTGSRPFVGASFHELASAKLDPAYDPAAHVGAARFPAFARGFFLRALHQEPSQRFQDVEEFRGALVALLDEWQLGIDSGALAGPRARSPRVDSEMTTAREKAAPAIEERGDAPRDADERTVAPVTARGEAISPIASMETLAPAHGETTRRSWLPLALVALVVSSFAAVLLVMWSLDRRPDRDPPTTADTGDAKHPPRDHRRTTARTHEAPDASARRPAPPPADRRTSVDDPHPKTTTVTLTPVNTPDAGSPSPTPTIVLHPTPAPTIVAPKPPRPPISGPRDACRRALGESHHLDSAKVPLNPLHDHAAALRECPAACDSGDAFACWASGRLFDLGLGTKRDVSRAQTLYRKACELGEGRGCRFLAYHLAGGKRSEVWQKLIKGCLARDAGSCVELGLMYEEGRGFPAKDLSIAQSHYQTACELKHAVGCARLAQLYLLGIDGKRDARKATLYYRRACALGHAASCQAAKRP